MKFSMLMRKYLVNLGTKFVWYALLAGLPNLSVAQVSEYEVKAAFLFNFALFTQPISKVPSTVASSTIDLAASEAKTDDNAVVYRICIYGKSPFGAALKSLANRKIARRPIIVAQDVALETLKACSLVFIAEEDRDAVRRATTVTQGLPIITVAESKEFPLKNIMFNLTVIDDKVAFQINTVAAKAQQLDISTKLIRLAKSVH